MDKEELILCAPALPNTDKEEATHAPGIPPPHYLPPAQEYGKL